MQSKYVLTYELKILYCQDIDLNFSCKELNLSTLQFHLYDGNKKDLNTGFELNPEEINNIAQEILMGKTGYVLSDKKMEWLEKFETLLKSNMKLLLNKNVAYTYFILKLQLLGFSEEVAKDIVSNYYTNIENNQKVVHQQIFLKNINKYLKEKIFWVPNNLEKEELKEYQFLEKVINSKLEMMYKFSFDQLYREQYLFLLKTGIFNTFINYNLYPSYLIRQKHAVIDLIPYMFTEYEKIITKLMTDIYNKNYLAINTGFIQDTIQHMEKILRFYLSFNYK